MNTIVENTPAPVISPSVGGHHALNPLQFMSLPSDIGRLFSLMNPAFVAGHGLAVQFIGAQPGEGVSTIARDFALTAAQHVDGPVLLLDFDWGRDSHFTHFQRLFQQRGEPIDLAAPVELGIDLSPLVGLSGPYSAVSPLTFHDLPGLDVILGRTACGLGAMPDRLPSILNRPDIWTELRRHFMVIVVDSPPSSQSFDGIVLSGAMDAVVLVVRAESTRAPVVEDLRDRLIAQGAPLAGLVLNQRRFYIPRMIYRLLDRL
jgi:Mrp family chromosome partitioning ATPase